MCGEVLWEKYHLLEKWHFSAERLQGTFKGHQYGFYSGKKNQGTSEQAVNHSISDKKRCRQPGKVIFRCIVPNI